jgi:hypothetical protein
LINRSEANMMHLVCLFALNDPPRRDPMLERAIPVAHPEITLDEGRAPGRPVVPGAILHGAADRLARLLRAVGAFFAAGGALS